MAHTRTRKKNVWLFTWEYVREDYFRHLGRQKIAAVLDSRIQPDFIEKYLQLLYHSERPLAIHEKSENMYYSSTRHPKDPNWKRSRVVEGKYRFGEHPWLEARRVREFFVDVVHHYFQISYWIENEIYDPKSFPDSKVFMPARSVRLESRHLKTGYDERIFYNKSAIPPRQPISMDSEFSEEDYPCL